MSHGPLYSSSEQPSRGCGACMDPFSYLVSTAVPLLSARGVRSGGAACFLATPSLCPLQLARMGQDQASTSAVLALQLSL